MWDGEGMGLALSHRKPTPFQSTFKVYMNNALFAPPCGITWIPEGGFVYLRREIKGYEESVHIGIKQGLKQSLKQKLKRYEKEK